MYNERKIIIVDCCGNCPFNGKCDPWLRLTKTQRVTLYLGNNVKPFILKGCPLPDGENDAKPFKGI